MGINASGSQKPVTANLHQDVKQPSNGQKYRSTGSVAHRNGGNKYHANPTSVRLPSGEVKRFASAKEANRYRELLLLVRAHEIRDLECQVEFELVPHQVRPDGKKEQPVKYIADFCYYTRNGEYVVEDVKGYKDAASAAYKLYTIKRKLMLERYKIAIKEV